MNIKREIKKVVDFLLQDRHVVKIKISQVNYGGILKDRHIVVTGGGSGLGLAMARKFVHEGALVLIVGRNEKSCYLLQKNWGRTVPI